MSNGLTNLKLARLLRRLFVMQAREVIARLTWEETPDLAYLLPSMMETLRPALLPLFQGGMRRSKIATKKPLIIPIFDDGAGFRRYNPAKGFNKGIRKNLYAPKILDALDQLTLTLCRTTLETAQGDITTAQGRVRQAVREGLSLNMAQSQLRRMVGQILTDPKRVTAIVVTETARIANAGQLLAAKESGVVWGKEWQASPNACSTCRELNGKQVAIDEPFAITGPGPYGTILYPPYHPHCTCSWSEVL